MSKKSDFILPKGDQLCVYCKNACGGCPWTELLPDGSIRFAPVPGWDATPTVRKRHGKVVMTSYSIRKCPLFEEDRRDDFKMKIIIISMIRAGLTNRQISISVGVPPNDVAVIRHKVGG